MSGKYQKKLFQRPKREAAAEQAPEEPVVRPPRRSLTGKQLFLLILNGVLLLGVLACALQLRSVTSALITQDAATVWRGDSEMRFAQISCFLPADSTKTLTDIQSFHSTLDQAMIDASLEAPENGSLYVDAYACKATLSVTGDHGNAEVKTIGVGGDFFLFHPLTLVSGSYITAEDYMQDRVILDEELAWSLFGSSNVAGMTVTIGERPYYIAGVISRENDFASKKAYQDGPGMFMSYDALNAIQETGITTYEIVMPDMITGYAKSIVTEKFSASVGTVVENNSRYSLESLLDVIFDFGQRSMNTSGIIYPYWENAARLTEDYAGLLVVLLTLLSICPITTATVYIIRYLKGVIDLAKEKIPEKIEEKVEAEKEKHYIHTGI